MTIRCEQLDDLLLEGDSFSMQAAAIHAQSCAECMEKLATWNEISETARTLKTTWSSDLLWPGIQRQLGTRAAEAGGTPRFWRMAVAAVLTITIGATAWYSVRDSNRDAAFDQKILQVSAIEDVETAEQAHVAAISRLEQAAEPTLDEAGTPIMVSYKEKLMLLDDAIAECKAGIEQNRQNAYLRRELLAMYSEKQRTLRAVIREGNDASNQ